MSISDTINRILTNPEYHDVLAIIKGTRNGIVYGAKLRFCHALVMSFLFRSGPVHKRWEGIIKNTKDHARALGSFVFVYKLTLYLLKKLRQSKVSTLTEISSRSNGVDAFIGGLVGGYLIFGRNSKHAALSTINQQMVLYVFSRVVLGLSKKLLDWLSVQDVTQRTRATNVSWALMSSLSWAIVMALFRTDKDVLQRSMLHSMNFLYIDSETWTGIGDFF